VAMEVLLQLYKLFVNWLVYRKIRRGSCRFGIGICGGSKHSLLDTWDFRRREGETFIRVSGIDQ